MDVSTKHKVLLLVIILLAYLLAHWSGVRSQYVINDDVRQQIYWMQKWQDPDLFEDHYLTEYAKQYVPWGVKVIYRAASYFINPVQFSKVLSGLLFLMTAGSLFLLASRLGDELTGVVTVCVFLYFGFFLGAVSGGLSRGFVFPLLILYLFFLSGNEVFRAGIVIMVQALFNPYLCLLCLVTHGLFLLCTQWFCHFPRLRDVSWLNISSDRRERLQIPMGHLLLSIGPVCVGVVLLVAKYRLFTVPDFGEIVSYGEMVGNIEYTAAGRYEIIPVPSMFFECVRPFIQFPPLGVSSVIASVTGTLILAFVAVSGWNTQAVYQQIQRLEIFLYLLFASVFLYFLARLVLMDLFLPSRYMEYSLTVVYCVLTGMFVCSGMEYNQGIKKHTILLVILLVFLGTIRLHGIGIYDYTKQSSLYQFFLTTPKNCTIAGHPDIMDNVMTFSKRKVFVSYELSHTWYDQYWSTIKSRTYQFFNAYYSENPDELRDFCRKYEIDYMVVRESDFQENSLGGTADYFEPFGTYIQGLLRGKSSFAVFDETNFRPVYSQDGIRVLAFGTAQEQGYNTFDLRSTVENEHQGL